MYHLDLSIAGLLIRVESVVPLEKLYDLQNFAVDYQPHASPDALYQVQILPDNWSVRGELLIKSEQNAVYRCDNEWHRYFYWVAGQYHRYVLLMQKEGENILYLQSDRLDEFLPRFRLSAFLSLERILLQHQGFLLHSSVIRSQGRGILFSAPSGTGKSTQAELWRRERGAEIMNGDRGLIRKIGDDFMVYGSPYAGTSDIFTNLSAPISAIVVLSQASENSVKRLSPMEAFRKLYRESTVFAWDADFVMDITRLLGDLVSCVPVFHLACTPTSSAVAVLEEELVRHSVM